MSRGAVAMVTGAHRLFTQLMAVPERAWPSQGSDSAGQLPLHPGTMNLDTISNPGHHPVRLLARAPRQQTSMGKLRASLRSRRRASYTTVIRMGEEGPREYNGASLWLSRRLGPGVR